MLVQRRNQAEGCQVYHHKNTSEPETDALELNTVAATADAANRFNDTAPTSSVFTVESHSTTNNTDDTYVAWLWTEKQGYSRFGSFVGNGNANGPFCYTGFSPSYVMIKKTSATENWSIYDTKRNLNGTTNTLPLNADNTGVEADNTGKNLDILSNGFKILTANGELNTDDGTYIYIAFAEAPLVNSNGIPATAR